MTSRITCALERRINTNLFLPRLTRVCFCVLVCCLYLPAAVNNIRYRAWTIHLLCHA